MKVEAISTTDDPRDGVELVVKALNDAAHALGVFADPNAYQDRWEASEATIVMDAARALGCVHVEQRDAGTWRFWLPGTQPGTLTIDQEEDAS